MPPETDRLAFTPLSIEAIEAFIAGDRERLEAATGATFPEPVAPPPEMADALPFMRDTLRDDPSSGAWGPFLLVLRDTGEAAGSAGFIVNRDEMGTVVLGYSVYPSMQGCGIASEAASALVHWALAQPGVERVQATIPRWHGVSQRVAARAGLRRSGKIEDDPDEGLIDVWERTRK